MITSCKFNDLISSGKTSRSTEIEDAYIYVSKKLGQQAADEIFIDNPQAILDNAKHCLLL